MKRIWITAGFLSCTVAFQMISPNVLSAAPYLCQHKKKLTVISKARCASGEKAIIDLASIAAIGPTGPQGATGSTGPKGDTGATGEKGDKGETGPIGLSGPKGDSGERGPQGSGGAFGGYMGKTQIGWSTGYITPVGASNGTGNDEDMRLPISRGCLGRELFAAVSDAPGAGASYVFTLVVNGSDTPVSCAVTDANLTCASAPAASVSLSAGDFVSLKTSSTGDVGNTTVKFSWVCD